MKTEKEIQDLLDEIKYEISDKDIATQRKKYLNPVQEVLEFILR